jgi:FtsH-binding integral membrane protein
MLNEETVNDGNMKLALLGALSLYLDFVNLFLQLLRLFGKRR